MQKVYLFRSDDVEADLCIAGAAAIACIDPVRSSVPAVRYHKDTIRLELAKNVELWNGFPSVPSENVP